MPETVPDNPSRPEVMRHVSRRRKRRRPPAKIQPMLTPMIDVTFMLLLFFVLSMHFRQAEGQIPADLPQLQGVLAKAQIPLEPLVIRLRHPSAEGEFPDIAIGREEMTAGNWEELFQRLDGLRRQGSAEIPIVIKPERDVPWNDVVNAYNQAARAKFKSVVFAPAGQ